MFHRAVQTCLGSTQELKNSDHDGKYQNFMFDRPRCCIQYTVENTIAYEARADLDVLDVELDILGHNP